ncbi:MAG: radical SAM protein [Elusimicrobiota bacterium]|jgi:wyosine [tRNA(Phe)-imidazoG37] synthetase (radical SAM superfamily)|nr:radical SAM protein [Elusimicrobiota bacterium]
MKFQLGQDLIDILRGKKKIVFIDRKRYRKNDKTKKFFNACGFIMDGGISFQPNNILSCCNSRIVENLSVGNINDMSIDKLKKMIVRKESLIISDFKNGKVPFGCIQCRRIKRYSRDDMTCKDIKYITLRTFTKCNLKCIFCSIIKKYESGNFTDTDMSLVIATIKAMHVNGMLSKDFFTAIDGGEPSLYENDLSDIVNFIISIGGTVRIISNGAKFIETVAKAVKNGKCRILFSVDAGSREVYKKIKGADYFDATWENVKKYIDYVGDVADDRIRVKFILQPENVNDIENMVNMCVKYGVKNPCLDIESSIRDYNLYKEPVMKFNELCKNNKIKVAKWYLFPTELKKIKQG